MSRCNQCDFRADDLAGHAAEAGHRLRTCSVEACAKPAPKGRPGLCSMHDARLRRHGNFDGLRPHGTPEQRFWAKVEKTAECWLWRGSINNKGYGRLFVGFEVAGNASGSVYAHRWAYEHFVGVIPSAMVIRHACDTPACVNPEHLGVGTMADNSADMVGRGRHGRANTCAKGHPWTPENTLVVNRGKARKCRICKNGSARRRYRERRDAA